MNSSGEKVLAMGVSKTNLGPAETVFTESFFNGHCITIEQDNLDARTDIEESDMVVLDEDTQRKLHAILQQRLGAL